jgi:hypothetical protein
MDARYVLRGRGRRNRNHCAKRVQAHEAHPRKGQVIVGHFLSSGCFDGMVSGVKHSYSSTAIIFPHSSLGFLSTGRLGAKPCAARRAARLGRSGEPACTDGLDGAHVLNRGPEPCRICLFFVSSRYFTKNLALGSPRSDRWPLARPIAPPHRPPRTIPAPLKRAEFIAVTRLHDSFSPVPCGSSGY